VRGRGRSEEVPEGGRRRRRIGKEAARSLAAPPAGYWKYLRAVKHGEERGRGREVERGI
jgi:hypothetical protein